MLRFSLRSAALALALLTVPASAHAAQITGDPLSVASADDSGRLGVAFTGSGQTEFYGSSVDPATGAITPANSAGFVAVTVDPKSGVVERYGSRQGNVTSTSAPAVTGSGSAADPFRIVQTFAGGTALEIKQELTYVTGETRFGARVDVRNVSGTPLDLRVSMGADLAGGGSDTGAGVFEAGPPRFIGGFNTTVGAVAGLSEVTPWSHYEEGAYASVLGRADEDPRTGRLQDTFDPAEVDNGAAVQWDGTTLAPGAGAGFAVHWRFTRTFDVTPEKQSLNTGDTAAFAVTSRTTDGRPRGNAQVRYAVFGSNTATGAVRTGANGEGAFEYIGGNPGTDRVTVYADLNDNNQRDDGEPQREATVEWSGPSAPTFGQEANVRPIKGTVLIRVPRNANVSGKWAHAAQSRFVRLTGATTVPMGSQLDTTRGTVQLTSAAGAGGGVQTSQFYSGRFQVLQRPRERGITEMRMTGQLKCTSGRGKLVSSASRSRRLWGRGKGRFRTRGRNSSATVRGTQWLTKDTCTTTTTTVKQGVVVVKDFAKRKTVRVKAGRRYVARARRR